MTGLIAFAIAAVAGVSAYAFTASNTVNDHYAGAGVAAVTGYTVSYTSYNWNPAGTAVESVTFQLDHAAHDVKAALTAAAPTQTDWVDCGSVAATTDVTCTFASPVTNANAVKLSIAAVENGTVVINAT
jgi:hypothetical protein